jgi:hypothetical protein
MNSVIRYFGQFLAMIAMVASAVNAQCALSCLAQMPAQHSAIHASAHETNSHACCSHGKMPDRKQQPSEQPCPTPLPSVSATVVIPAAQQTDLDHLVGVGLCPHAVVPVLPVQWQPTAVSYDSSGLHHPPSFSVLRV